jgi:hypothetical protein
MMVAGALPERVRAASVPPLPSVEAEDPAWAAAAAEIAGDPVSGDPVAGDLAEAVDLAARARWAALGERSGGDR